MQSVRLKTNAAAIGSSMKGYQEGLAEADLESPLVVSDGLSFRFLTFTKPDEHRDEKIRRHVRSHAQRNYQTRRKVLSKMRPPAIRPLVPAASSYASVSLSVPSPVTYLAAGLVDPFSTLPIRLSDSDRFVLNRFHQFAIEVDSSGRFLATNTMSSVFLPTAMKDPILIYTILRTGARCLESSYPADKRFHQLGLAYEGELIAAINQVFADEQKATSDSVISGLCQLMGHAYISESNCEKYHLHARAIKHLVDIRGGLGRLGLKDLLASSISRIDIGAASHFGTEPYYPQNTSRNHVVSIGSLNPGFLQQIVLSNLSKELMSTLNDTCAIVNTANSNQGIFRENEVQTSYDRVLLVNRTRGKSDGLYELPDINLCAGLAAQIFFTVTIAAHSLHAFPALHKSRELYEAVSRLLALDTPGCLDLLFWAAFMASSAVEVPDQVQQWIKVIAAIIGRLGIGTWEEAISILKTFLWLEPRSEQLGNATWLRALGVMNI